MKLVLVTPGSGFSLVDLTSSSPGRSIRDTSDGVLEGSGEPGWALCCWLCPTGPASANVPPTGFGPVVGVVVMGEGIFPHLPKGSENSP